MAQQSKDKEPKNGTVAQPLNNYHFLFFSSNKVNTDLYPYPLWAFSEIRSLNSSLRLQPVLRILPSFAASVLVRLPGIPGNRFGLLTTLRSTARADYKSGTCQQVAKR